MTRVLLVSGDVVDVNMGGMGVRYWELAHALAPHCRVTLAIPNPTQLVSSFVELRSFDLQHGDLREWACCADAIIVQGFILHFHPYLRELGIPLAVDLYVPYLLENLVWHAADDLQTWIPAYEEYSRIQTELLRAGDFFFCASERQRDYWLGGLQTEKRINPHTFKDDPTLRQLIDVVPFGLPADPPVATRPVLKGIHPAIPPDAQLILWSGGLWDWLDPLTLIHAVAQLAPMMPKLRLYFAGSRHPNPIVSGMTMMDQARHLSDQLGLTGRAVFFGDWIPYAERANYLQEADLAVVSHQQHIETHFSFRTRVLDCIWAGVPLVVTDGDVMADWVRAHRLGVVVPAQDRAAMANAIAQVLERAQDYPDLAFDPLRAMLRWDRVILPLAQFCRAPRRAPDQGLYLTDLERVSRDKDKFLARVIQDKDAFLDQVIQAKEAFLNQVIRDKDQFLAGVVKEKDAILAGYRHLAPFVSVIIVNYNGRHFLPACLDALRAQNYPRDHFEVIVSDNGSTDSSLELLRDEYPWVRVLANESNLGFASGNNVAIRVARGHFIVLLNNDTAPAPEWLAELVAVAQGEPRAGLVTGHLQLFYDQLVLTLEAEAFTPGSQDPRELGIQVCAVETETPGGVYQYLDGFYGWETLPSGQRFRWTGRTAQLGVPVPRGEGEWQIRFQLAAAKSDGKPVPVKVKLQDKIFAEWNVAGIAPVEYVLTLPADTRALAAPLVQNTGSLIFRNGSGRDRGTWVRDAQVFYETDQGQYNRIEEVFAGCGASLLLDRAMLEEIGLFDDDFFMYYEDTDLAWRARLRGWKVFYAPQAIVRHIHCGTSKEWSPAFIFHAERNRLAMLWKNGTRRQTILALGKYLGRMSLNAGAAARALLLRRDWKMMARHVRIELRALWGLIAWLPSLELERHRIQSSRKVAPAAIAAWFVE